MIDHGVPFNVAHALEEDELFAYALMFAKFENGNKEWDWDSMSFVDKP